MAFASTAALTEALVATADHIANALTPSKITTRPAPA
jgi:hypothetical protein